MPTIKAQVKLADIKSLMMAGTCAYYLCHNVAHLLEPELEKAFPQYRQFANEGMDGLIGHNGIAYHFLCQHTDTEGFDTQVVSCIQNFMLQVDPGIEPLLSSQPIYMHRHTLLKFLNIKDGSNWTSRRLRIDTLGKILKAIPNATMTITLEV